MSPEVNPQTSDAGLLSVVVSSFKRYDYLKTTLKSICAQTYRNLEVLVVADGDDPEIKSVVSGLGDARVKYLFTPHAGFPAVPRNEGLRNAQGKWLAFCDDDDLWHPEKVACQIPVLQNSKYSLCTCDYDYIDQDGNQVDIINYYDAYFGQFDWRTFYHSMGFICNAAAMFTRQMADRVGEVNESPSLRAHEDFEYWMRMLFEGDGFMMKDKLVSYRVHPGSIQRHTPWQVYRRRTALQNSLRQTPGVPMKDHLRKSAKYAAHFLFDQFPVIKTGFRKIQGKSHAQ